MVRPSDLVVWLSDVDHDDAVYVGETGADFGKMIQARFPISSGFVITRQAYIQFLKESRLDQKIEHLLATVNFSDSRSVSQVTKYIRDLILISPIPAQVVKSIFQCYEKLGNTHVALRSSHISSSSKIVSFSQNETFLNIQGEASVIEKVREGWASLYNPSSVVFRHENKISHIRTGIALVVQNMIASEVSGVLFTLNPTTFEKSHIVIEAVYGLGEFRNQITPDHYEVDKKTGKILYKKVNPQKVMLASVNNQKITTFFSGVHIKAEAKEKKVPRALSSKQKITDTQILQLARLGTELEKCYYFPQEAEWVLEKGKLYIVKRRPITTIHKQHLTGSTSSLQAINETTQTEVKNDKKSLLGGDSAYPGIGIGFAKVLKSSRQLHTVRSGDILVVPFTTPDYISAMKKASAIVTESGGYTSHAAIVCRSFGIPAVVGIQNATKKIKDNSVITVNGTTGEVLPGSFVEKNIINGSPRPKTKTEVFVTLDTTKNSKQIAEADGVGFVSSLGIIKEIGVHPKKLIKEGKQGIITERITKSLYEICQAFYPQPVYFCANDLKTNEYRNLVGGREFEEVESDPILGFRGAYRYIHYPEVFHLELAAIKNIRRKFDNLNLMIPFVRTPKELEEVKKIITLSGLRRSSSFKLIMVVEIPSNVILLEEFIKIGIDGVCLGLDTLTTLFLATDRDNLDVTIDFDERNESIAWAVEKVVRTARKYGITSSVYGQATSVYPSFVRKLVEFGITSISVDPSSIDSLRKTIYNVEREELIIHAKN